ncbi:hypothetical protein GOP47_0026901 [Adiantum capillus-veneris]|nr:hypothetical protein GOP47_0026901 [Adiantum capillus-veneris]
MWAEDGVRYLRAAFQTRLALDHVIWLPVSMITSISKAGNPNFKVLFASKRALLLLKLLRRIVRRRCLTAKEYGYDSSLDVDVVFEDKRTGIGRIREQRLPLS